MKLLVIGDLHGLNIWKKLIEKHNPDKVIFLGDYVDSFTISDIDMINNLEDIIEYKKANLDNTILLLGNHDISYIYDGNKCSGNRENIRPLLENIYKKDLDLFKIIHEENGYLFSHAGITDGWIEQNKNIIGYQTISEEIEEIFKTEYRDILFQAGKSRGGRFEFGGPLWADKKETENLDNFGLIQVVGHSHVKTVTYGQSIIYCDCLEYGDGNPLILEI